MKPENGSVEDFVGSIGAPSVRTVNSYMAGLDTTS
jgi:hypothetical protein